MHRFRPARGKIQKLRTCLLCLVAILMIGACTQQDADSATPQYRDIGWEDLEPKGELTDDELIVDHSLGLEPQGFENEGTGNGDVGNGDFGNADFGNADFGNERNVFDQYTPLPGQSSGYYGAPPPFRSASVVKEMDGQSVRIPGFIVPVEFEGENLVTEFFLVPYFGACFHMPPPPPNQTIYVTSTEPIEYKSIYDPVWIKGVIKTEQQGNGIATASYSIDFHMLEPFVE